MIDYTINNENLKNISWENNFFKYAEIQNISIEGGQIDSDFVSCTFQNCDWYWGMFNIVNFIDCKFTNCTFRGASFYDCKFVECEFDGCNFIKDNLNSDCVFENTKAYNCTQKNCIGFNAKNLG